MENNQSQMTHKGDHRIKIWYIDTDKHHHRRIVLLDERGPKPRNFWQLWVAWLIFVLSVHALTFSISPPIWQDEVQIIEWGRTAIDQSTDWSINWNADKNLAVINPFYLGSLVQNIVFSLSGHNIVMPRILSSVGAITASTSCLTLLLSYGHGRLRSSLLSSVLLLDPLFVAGYRGDRVDCWVIAAAFLSCIALQKSICSENGRQTNRIALCISGAVAAVGLALWFSFILLLPLIAWQLTSIATESNLKRLLQESSRLLGFFSFWAAGFTTCFIIIMLPMLSDKPDLFDDILLTINRVSQKQDIASSFIYFLSSFRRNPGILIITSLCLFIRPRLDLLFFSGVALAGVLSSSTYDHRAVYMIPYMILICSFSLDRSYRYASSNATPLHAKSLEIALWITVSISFIVSLIIRPFHAISTIDSRRPQLIYDVALQAIGEGNHKVLLGPWEFYVSGRKLGWKMYKPFFGQFSKSEIAKMNFIILNINDVNASKLPIEGYVRIGTTWLDIKPSRRTLDAFKSGGYGPYVVYKNMSPTNHPRN